MFMGTVNGQTEPTRVINGKTYIVHKVIAGETYYKLSKKYHLTVSEIQAANPEMKSLKAGEELLIPSEKSVAVVNNGSNNSKQITHVVKKGETLSAIARKYNVSVDEIKKGNSLESGDLKIGQKLIIPSKLDVKPDEVVPVSKPVVTPTPVKPIKDTSSKSGSEGNKPDNNPGIQNSNTKAILVETATEKEETGLAKISMDLKLDQTRTFVFHPTLQKGSIIVVINEQTGKMAYCRVLDNPLPGDMQKADILITKAVAEKIGMSESSGTVKIKYAVP